jgi:16S rRNA (uracil1498-N3)-methyltransferase
VNARFHAPGAEASGATIELPEDEGRHLARVMRLGVGAAIRVFNGRGREFEALVERIVGGRVDVRVGAPVAAASPEPGVAVTLALAVLKHEHMDEAIRNAVMMGAAAIQPIVAARSETTLAALQRGKRNDRWRRIAVSSAKQCGRATVPAIREPWPFDALPAALTRAALPAPGLMFVEPAASAGTVSLSDLDPAPPREATIVIGPEGGWTAGEVEQGAAVCRLVTLGRLTIRADAMPTVAMAALLTVWREM